MFKHGTLKEISEFSVTRVHLSIQQVSIEYLLYARYCVRIKDNKEAKGMVCALKEHTVQQRSGRIWKQ